VTGLVQGLALVTFPAASSIFTSPHGFGFSASRYGMMFIPQVILAILASSLAPRLALRWTLKRVFLAGLSADLLAMILLALSRLLQDSRGAAYGTLLVATGSLGFGFGAAVMAMNTYAEKFSPGRENRAVLALNALLGSGTALAPLFVAIFLGLGAWWLMPLMVAVVLVGLLFVSAKEPLEASVGAADSSSSKRLPGGFWLLAAAVLLYGIAETLPVVLMVAFQVISHAGGETSGIVAFGLAGLGCSAFFPLCISLSGQAFPRFAAVMSGEIVAFYQVGYGVAAFGVGPLRDFAGFPFSTIYSFGSLVAAAILAVAFVAITREVKVNA